MILILAGCTPRYVVPLSDSYSQTQFSKLSKGYEKTVDTIYGEEIPFDEVHIRNHTVYIVSKDSSEITRAIPLSQVNTINLISHPQLVSRLFATVAGTIIGVAAGWGLAKFIDSQHIASPESIIPIFDVTLIPLGGVMGGTVGYTASKTDVYKGRYLVIRHDTTYRLRPAKEQQPPKRPGVIMDN
jgi:hypothetical protein